MATQTTSSPKRSKGSSIASTPVNHLNISIESKPAKNSSVIKKKAKMDKDKDKEKEKDMSKQ